MQTFSLSQIITTAVITFFISGIGGALLTKFLSRARPKISVTSVGFHGNVVHLSDAAIDASVNDDWGPSLKGFVSYSTACSRENKSSKLILELGKVKGIVDEWLASNMLDNNNLILTKSELLRCPYFFYSQISSSIFGKLRRRSVPDLPITIESLEGMEKKFDLEEKDGHWVIHRGSYGTHFKMDSAFSEKEILQQRQIAESFSRGCLKNIRHIMQVFSTDTANEITKLIKLRDELRKCIAEGAHITLDAVISNLGDKPCVVTSYCSAKLGLGDETLPMLFRVTNEKAQSLHTNDQDIFKTIIQTKIEQSGETGEMFSVEPYLAEVSSSAHISVPGGGTTKIALTSIEPMGKIGEKLVKYFELGALTCSFTATTASGTSIKAPSITFGKELSEQQKQQLLSR